ncbi:MAG: ATP-dependent dethiobiotin synthetase BioD [Hyphomicrobiaceae bacterium]|nr:ATP-dependent dethiobiotin synthetase BioD [Hyphomicrobiaceae bacterium]MCC0009578.1 ATP-dependent dethiobiotin synthetase BioD [Hyphomicrobiaceae bacterium]
MTNAIVVSGTDTSIGKTVVSAALVGLLDGIYWKPVQAGLEDETDRDTVIRLAAIDPARALDEVYRLKTPASPHRAAELDDIEIDPRRLAPPQTQAPLIIETAGGLLVPITRHLLQIDLMAGWSLPTVLVASTRLGTINHTLLSVEALQRRDIAIAGLVFTGPQNTDTERTIAKFSGAIVLGRVPHLSPLDAQTLAAAASQHLDIAPLRQRLRKTQ